MPKRVTCQKCAYFDPRLCWYVASNGKRDKIGSVIKLDFAIPHNCQDYRSKNYAGGGIDWVAVAPKVRAIPLLLPEVG